MSEKQSIFLGRQAIFTRDDRVYGYELLYRANELNQATLSDGDQASSTVLLNACMELGLERIVDDRRAFINLTRHFLAYPEMVGEIPLDKSQLVLEVLENIEVDDHLVRSVSQLRQNGYSLALDDFALEERWNPLLPYANIIKLEVPKLDLHQLAGEIPRLRQHGALLLAEKVETRTQYLEYRNLGVDLFQGFYFSRPTLLAGTRANENAMVIMRLLARLNDPDVTIDELEKLITQDAALSYKILRYLNSAAIGIPRRIQSVREAVVFFGLQRIRGWGSLMVMARIHNKSTEYFNTALVRAHFCERQMLAWQHKDGAMAFSVGLLSVLDLLLDRPIGDIVAELPLTEQIKAAIVEKQGPLGQVLGNALACEQAHCDSVVLGDLRPRDLFKLYLESTDAAFTQLRSMAFQ